MADLFALDDLASWLQRDLDTATATRARRAASGWLRSATGFDEWPSTIPDDLWTWAVELAALAYTNPELLATETTGANSATWERGRRDDILRAAKAAYSGSGKPLYSFPDPDWHWTVVTSATAD